MADKASGVQMKVFTRSAALPLKLMGEERSMMADQMTFADPDEAFERAISEGRLSREPGQPNYAGDYMYMGTVDSGEVPRDLFKNLMTRKYDV